MAVEWLEEYAQLATAPIPGEDPSGVGLFDEEEYEALREEIARGGSLQGESVDWSRVESLSSTLLETHSKDLLVAGYLAVALATQRGGRGQAAAAALLEGLARTSGDRVWPRSGRGRSGALEYMGAHLVKAARKLRPRPGDAEVLESAAGLARRAHAAFEATLPAAETRAGLQKFQSWVECLTEQSDKARRTAAKQEQPDSEAAVGAAAESGGFDNSSAEAVKTALPDVRTWLMRAGELLQVADPADPFAYRARRWAKWPDQLAFEAGADGRTAVPMLGPVQAESELGELARATTAEQLVAIEQAFVARPLWLDLQRVLCQRMDALGPGFRAARDAVHGEALALVTRLPRLLELSFVNGVPFASQATRTWLQAAGSTPSVEDVARIGANVEGEGDDVAARVQVASSLAAAGDLRAALEAYQEGLEGSAVPSARFRLRLALAQTCLDQGQTDLALPHLEALRKELALLTIGEWAPDLAVRVLSLLVRAHRASGANAGQAAEALSELSRLNPLAAFELEQS